MTDEHAGLVTRGSRATTSEPRTRSYWGSVQSNCALMETSYDIVPCHGGSGTVTRDYRDCSRRPGEVQRREQLACMYSNNRHSHRKGRRAERCTPPRSRRHGVRFVEMTGEQHLVDSRCRLTQKHNQPCSPQPRSPCPPPVRLRVPILSAYLRLVLLHHDNSYGGHPSRCPARDASGRRRGIP